MSGKRVSAALAMGAWLVLLVGGEASAASTVYEAEDATASGPVFANNHPGYTGTGFMDYWNPSGDYLEWTVTASSAARCQLRFRYALRTGNRPLEIRVNGAVVESSLSFPGTGSWSTWRTTSTFVELVSGTNTVRATAIGSSGANVDHLRVVELVDGLIAHWKLDEASGATAADVTGNGHNGTLVGDPAWQPMGGRVRGALEFDGAGDYVSVADEGGFDITSSITVSAWIKVSAFTRSWQAIVTKGDSSWRLHRSGNTNRINFACSGLSGAWNVTGSTNVNDGQWHHVAGVYDGTRLYVYVDGAEDASASAWESISTNNYEVRIGENAQATGRQWNGLIDDVRIYGRSLLPAEVQAVATPPELSVSPRSGLATSEDGSTATFTVRLTAQPSADVMVSLGSSDTSEGTVSPASLVFTVSDWATDQVVTLTGVDDSVQDGRVDYDIDFTVSSLDAEYDGLAVEAVRVANLDDELDPDLLAWWKLDETSGGTAFDSAGTNDGTNNGALIGQAGQVGTAYEFAGSSDHIAIGDPAALQVTGEITISAWINPHATNGIRNIVAKGYRTSPNQEMFLRINGGKYQIGSWNGSDHLASYNIPGGDVGTWVHLAGLYDGSAWRLYRNGMPVSSKTDATGGIQVDHNWAIAARGTGTERFFDGVVDDVRIYGRALTSIEVQELAGTVAGSGVIHYQQWHGIGGGAVSDLTASPDYPDNPTDEYYLTSFEAPQNAAGTFGSRIHGFIHPPQTGSYTFWIASDDASELWLSTDPDPANAVRIAHMSGWVGFREWDAKPWQESDPVSLEAGKSYYIMALHKDGGGADHVSVAWELPDATFHGPIPGAYLTPWSEPPVTQDDIYYTDLDTVLTVNAANGVLVNDSDPEGAAITAELVTGPSHAVSLALNSDGSFEYVPETGYKGLDSFVYRALDDMGSGALGTAYINVGNHPPVAADDSAVTDEDAAVVIDVMLNDSDPDSDPFSVTAVGDPAHGTAVVESDDTITYTPDPDWCGTDSFTYTLTDDWDGFDTGTVTVTVNPVNDAPAASDDDVGVLTTQTPVDIDVLANDTDADIPFGDALTVISFDTSTSEGGTITDLGGGVLRYTPASGWTGTDEFTYTVEDSTGLSDTATVTVDVLETSDGDLPAPWLHTDVGTPDIAGDASWSDYVFTVQGDGADIWGTADAFHYAYLTLTGDCEVVARVASQEDTHEWAKAGVMIRENLTATSKHAMVVATPRKGIAMQYRASTGGESSWPIRESEAAPYWVKLVRHGDVFKGYASPDGETWSWLWQARVPMAESVHAGLCVTSHNRGAVSTATFDNVRAHEVTFEPLPSPWQHADVGSVRIAGDALYSDGEFTVEGSGYDIWQTADAFHYVYQEASGDFQITARVASQDFTDNWAKAGVMVRESLAAGSRHAMVVATPLNGISMQRRGSTGGSSERPGTTWGFAPCWVRLLRSGDKLIGYASLDGLTWEKLAERTMAASDPVLVGLCVTAHNDFALSRVRFDEIELVYQDVAFNTTASNGDESVSPDLAVSLSLAVDHAVSVDYSPTGGTATRDDDYTLADGTLTFGPWETTKFITIAVVDDAEAEVDETIEVTLSSPVGATFGANTVHTYTINEFGLVSRETVDADGDGRIDGIRMVAGDDLNDEFTGLQIEVEGYTVTNASTGDTANDAEFIVLLAEGDEPDTGATPGVRIVSNTSLAGAGSALLATDSAANIPLDMAAPVVVDTWPAHGQQYVSIWADLEVEFSEWMDDVSTLPAYSIKDATNTDVPGGACLAGSSLLFIPDDPLELDAVYTMTVAAGAEDLAGNSLADALTVTFNTGAKLFVDIPETSAVSPVFIEGQFWVPEGTTPDITATGPMGTVAATILGERNFFVNVPLEPGENDVTVTMNSGVPSVAEQVVVWTATDLAGKSHSSDEVLLRKGDSLLLTATDGRTRQDDPDEATGALYRFDDLEAVGIALDSSWNGNDGTLVGGAVKVADGRLGAGALSLDGVDDYVNVPDAASLELGGGDFTLEAWIVCDTVEGQHDILAKESVQDLSYVLQTRDGLLRLVLSSNGRKKWDIVGSTPIQTGVWTHVAAVRSADSVKLSVNGVEDAVGVFAGPVHDGPCPFRIGAESTAKVQGTGKGQPPNHPQHCFDGLIDEVRISHVDRSPTWGTQIKIDADGDGGIDFTGEPGDTCIAMYDEADEFIAEAWLDGNPLGTLLVVAFDVDLTAPIACQVGFRREKDVVVAPAGRSSDIRFAAVDPEVMFVAVKESTAVGATLYLKPHHRGTPVLAARLGSGPGPIIAWREIDEFTLDVPARCCVTVNDDTDVGASKITMRPYVPHVTLEFDMFASQSTYAGGATHFTVNTSDATSSIGEPGFQQVWDSGAGETTGEFVFDLEVPDSELNWACCMNIRAWQVGSEEKVIAEETGVNGKICKGRVAEIVLCVDATENLAATLTYKKGDLGPKDIVITGGPEGATRPKFTKTNSETVPGGFDCDQPIGTVFTEEVTAAGATPGEYDVEIGLATFDDAITVCSVDLVPISVPRDPDLEPGRICRNGGATWAWAWWNAVVKPAGTTATVTVKSGPVKIKKSGAPGPAGNSVSGIEDGDTIAAFCDYSVTPGIGPYVLTITHDDLYTCTADKGENVFRIVLATSGVDTSPATTGNAGTGNYYVWQNSTTPHIQNAADLDCKRYFWLVTEPAGMYDNYCKAKVKESQKFENRAGTYGVMIFNDLLNRTGDISCGLNFGLVTVGAPPYSDEQEISAFKGDIRIQGPNDTSPRSAPTALTVAKTSELGMLQWTLAKPIGTTSTATTPTNHYKVGDSSSRGEAHSQITVTGAIRYNSVVEESKGDVNLEAGKVVHLEISGALELTSSSAP